ncbi:unnamed protein product [Closterium sp. NIES-54]
MGLVLGGHGSVVLTGHSDTSWADNQATQRSSQGYTFSVGSGFVSWRSTRFSSVLGSSCDAEIYAWAMAAQEPRWLTVAERLGGSATLDSGASQCFFRDHITVTPLSAPVPVGLADPTSGPAVACSSTTLPCPAVPSGFLTGLYIPSFSRNLVGVGYLQC